MRRRKGYAGYSGFRRRRRGRKAAVILGVIAGIVILLAVIAAAVRIREIEVTGNKHYSDEQIVDMLFDGKWSRNSAYCYYENRFREHRSLPFIEDYKINFKSPTKVEIVVFEKSVVGYVSYMSSYMYFDKDGIIVESSDEQLPGVPWITGLEFGHIILHQPLPVENPDTFGDILNLTQVLSVNEVSVDKIYYRSYASGSGDVELYIGDVTVELGSAENVSGKVGELANILPELTGLSGTLYLDTYNEADSTPTYTFKKSSEQTAN